MALTIILITIAIRNPRWKREWEIIEKNPPPLPPAIFIGIKYQLIIKPKARMYERDNASNKYERVFPILRSFVHRISNNEEKIGKQNIPKKNISSYGYGVHE